MAEPVDLLKQTRILLGFHHYPSPADSKVIFEAMVERFRKRGYRIDTICLTLNPPGPRLVWKDLDRDWKRGNNELMRLYESVAVAIDNHDIFINCDGINLHPEFVSQLPIFKVFAFYDDPESSEYVSRPTAAAYDLCLVGNIAMLDTYRQWGVKNAIWTPAGFHEDHYDSSLTKGDILAGKGRDVDMVLLCERIASMRSERLDKLHSAFPQGRFHGQGWPTGFLPQDRIVPLYQRAKIGPNLHNSTGPINARTFMLPANGVMQVCDNKSHLGKIFELGKEVAGFDTIDECIELCRYYLAHEEERRVVAAAGWERALRDYNEEAVFRRAIGDCLEIKKQWTQPQEHSLPVFIRQHEKATRFSRMIGHLRGFARRLRRKMHR